MDKKYDLNDRLIDFGVMVIDLSNNINHSSAGVYLANQILRSGVSPALHYGEAQGAESRKDFIHKLGILIKELRETLNALKIIKKAQLTNASEKLDNVLSECNELISIFNKSIETAKKNSGIK